jgi:hypothetical protein
MGGEVGRQIPYWRFQLHYLNITISAYRARQIQDQGYLFLFRENEKILATEMSSCPQTSNWLPGIYGFAIAPQFIRRADLRTDSSPNLTNGIQPTILLLWYN